jgi:uncharacterized membrane protein YeaQ/YmgE (transglycosylase-associated protein family)
MHRADVLGPRVAWCPGMSIIAFIILGLVAGLLARALMPGRQSMGIVATMLLGMLGSFVGGAIVSVFTRDRLFDLNASGLLGSVIGAIVVLVIAGAASRRRSFI